MADRPKHVLEQLALSMSEAVREAVPQFEGRCFINGAPGWDRRSYPMCLVAVGRTKKLTVPDATGRRTGRLQINHCEVIVEFAELITGDDAPARLSASLAEISADVADALAGFAGVPVSDIAPVADSGLEDVETRDQRGLLGTRSLSFLVTFHTVEGDSRAFYAPNAF